MDRSTRQPGSLITNKASHDKRSRLRSSNGNCNLSLMWIKWFQRKQKKQKGEMKIKPTGFLFMVGRRCRGEGRRRRGGGWRWWWWWRRRGRWRRILWHTAWVDPERSRLPFCHSQTAVIGFSVEVLLFFKTTSCCNNIYVIKKVNEFQNK